MLLTAHCSEETQSAYKAPGAKPAELMLSRLTGGEETEVLRFLARRPTHTFALSGFIRDNGLCSPLNRGKFYACRNAQGGLAGVALIGHAVLFEVSDEAAIERFARLARSNREVFMALAEQEKMESFCDHYFKSGLEPRLIRRELLLEQRRPVVAHEFLPGLRKAKLDDLDKTVNAHAQLGVEERGFNPFERDPLGFRERCARRIELGRTWVMIQNDKLIFKADVVSATPEVNYIEGIWVTESERSRGHGLRCLSQLTRTLLQQTGAVCLFLCESRAAAQRFYAKAGYKPVGYYETVYL